MKEKIEKIEKQENDKRTEDRNHNQETPMLHMSVTNLDIVVEEGRVYKDSFCIESENHVPFKGIVRSTNDKIGVETEEFSGTRVEIPFYFKGKLAMAGSEFEGDFLLITDGGEFNIPYRFSVVPKSAETSIGVITDMEGFTKLYLTSCQEAMELFFLPNFAEVFLKDLPEQKAMYHSLMKSRSRSMILEEFLSAAGYKEPARLLVDKTQIVLDAGKDKEVLTLKLEPEGYVEGWIVAKKGQVQLSRQKFTSNDFVNGCLEVEIEKNHSYLMGNDTIHIRTMRQQFTLSVEWWGTLPVFSRERENRNRIRKQQAELMHNYLYFRTGSIEFDDFAEESRLVLDNLFYATREVRWQLYQLQLLMMENFRQEAEERLKELEEKQKTEQFTPLEENYFLYLKAMFFRTPEAISTAVLSIREFYAIAEKKAEALWMLIYLDREYVYNKRLQYDTIKQLFQEGENSSLLYFEACEILNDNPNYMEELGAFEISIFRWGVRYGYISMALAYQFARLALRIKFYSSSIFHIAEKLYQVEPDDRFLQVICSLLIKGNRCGREYHEYFKSAVNANLKIIGLNEFFVRSMDFTQYEVIPHKVLIYFTYSNSLDSMEKAYFYSNVLENREVYDEVFGAYYAKMVPFVEEQLVKGKMNEHLAYLYHYFQKEILEKPDYTKAVCDILFYEKLTCKNRNMIGVYVSRPETGMETYYPFSGGVCYAEIPNSRTVLYFVDSKEQRYVIDVPCEREPFLSAGQFSKEWIQKNMANRRILLSLSDRIDDEIKAEDLPVLQKIAFDEEYQPWIKARAIEKLLDYYERHQNKEELARWLERIDYSNVSGSFRKRLMDYYMEVGMIENAYFGIELYGCGIMGAVKRLRLAVFGVRYGEGTKEDTTLYLAYSAFMNKKYNRDTLRYLMEHFRGEMEDLLLIWERSRKFGLKTSGFEKKMLEQSMFTGNDADGLFPVFEIFYQENQGDPLVERYLSYVAEKERKGSLELPESIHVIIGQEILEERITDRESKICFLYYFAGRDQWEEQSKDAAGKIIREMLEDEEYLPVFHRYAQWVNLPTEYLERTFLTYHGTPGKTVILYYQVEEEKGQIRKKYLQEILPGLYCGSMYFYQSDHVNYRLEEEGELVEDETRLRFETFACEGENSRFFALNQFSAEEADGEEIQQYLIRTFFTDQYMKLL